MSRRSERRWFIYERHRGWSLNPLTSRIILSSIDLSSHPVVFFRFVNFFPLPHAFPCSLSSNCCQFSREGRSYWLMITQDNNDHSRGDLYRLAWVFRATILLLPSCLERQSARSCFAGHTKNPRVDLRTRPGQVSYFVRQDHGEHRTLIMKRYSGWYTSIGSVSRSTGNRGSRRRNCRAVTSF